MDPVFKFQADKMKKIIIICFLLTIFFLWPSTTTAGNPFTSKPAQQHSDFTPYISPGFYARIVMWQQQLRHKMSELLRSVQTTKTIAPILFLAGFSFAYGVIHSAGPGHGKAIALSYILSCKPSLFQGLIFGNLLAITHGFSGILFILAVKFLFLTRVSGSLETVTHITQIISFSLIILLGFIIFIKNIYKWIRKPAISQRRYFTGPYMTALAAGCVPCPGVVMVMLFAISLNLTWLGILLGAFISIGMAFTVSCIVFLGIAGKTAVLSGTLKNKKLFFVVETIVETSAGLILAGLGSFFLLTM